MVFSNAFFRSKSSQKRWVSSPVLAMNTPTFPLTGTHASWSSSTLPSIALHECEICLNQSHRTLGCILFPCEALTNRAAIRTDHVQKNHSCTKRPPPLTPHYGSGKKGINVESISFYEKHLAYVGAGNEPYCISVVARILWSFFFASHHPLRFVNHGECCTL